MSLCDPLEFESNATAMATCATVSYPCLARSSDCTHRYHSDSSFSRVDRLRPVIPLVRRVRSISSSTTATQPTHNPTVAGDRSILLTPVALSTLATMRAVTQTAYGDPNDVLSFTTSHPAPAPPSAHQVQVRVHAATINPVDAKQLHGNLKAMISLKFPHVPGHDLSGVVTAVGSAVTRVKTGDAVMVQNSNALAGAYGELANVAEELLSIKPDNISFAEAAAFPTAAQTVVSGLDKVALASGEKIVVTGASGGVGSFAVQLAKLYGASEVVAVCSGKNAEYVKSLGADTVVDYTTQKLGDALQKEYDVVFDCVGGKDQWDEAQKVLKVNGRFITMVGDDRDTKVTVGAVLSVGSAMIGRKLSSVFSSQHHQWMLHMLTPHAKLLDRVVEYIKDGKLKVHIDKRFEFSERGVKDMYAYIETGRTVGKNVMEIVKDGDETAQTQQSTATTVSSSSASSSSTETTTDSSASASTSAATASGPSTDADSAIGATATDDNSSSVATEHAAHSTIASVAVAGGGTGGSVQGTVANLPTAPHSDVSTGSIE